MNSPPGLNPFDTDLQAADIALGIRDKSIFDIFEEHEMEYPVPRKEEGGRTVYASRPLDFLKEAVSICPFSAILDLPFAGKGFTQRMFSQTCTVPPRSYSRFPGATRSTCGISAAW
jgi:hypothetical protein